MHDKIRELMELNLVYKNSEAEWASPPLTLPKPGPDQYRMTVDLRLPNASKVPAAWPMHSLQHDLRDLNGSFFFKCWIFVDVIADTFAKRLSRPSDLHHAGWSIYTDACTTWN
jgi:hypothetical protein